MDFPCSVHKGSYENSTIAVDAEELKNLKADGWMTSAKWYRDVLKVPPELPEEVVKPRGRRPKTDDE